jgi:hypothetical protein
MLTDVEESLEMIETFIPRAIPEKDAYCERLSRVPF